MSTFRHREIGAESLAHLCAALGSGKRLDIMRVLTRSKTTVGALARTLDLDVSDISYHLGVMRAEDIVVFDPRKNEHRYQLHGRVTCRWEGHGKVLLLRIEHEPDDVLELRTDAEPRQRW